MLIDDKKFILAGFEKFVLLSDCNFEALKSFSEDWFFSLVEKYHPTVHCRQLPIDRYHLWSEELGIDHSRLLSAANRHQRPPDEISILLENEALRNVLAGINLKKYKFWDEGLGWLAFRLIRPGFGDGYPTSRKAWGPAKNVISVYVPIIGFAPEQSIALVEGSHLHDYPSVLPIGSKFCRDERRLDPACVGIDYTRPTLKPGDALIFHPLTLHSEDVASGVGTRMSLEFRVIVGD